MGKTLKPVSLISGAFGQEGELKIAELLEKELPNEYLVLNSPRVAYANNVVDIDHVIIAPTGIFVIECKNMNGRISGGIMGNWVQEKSNDGQREVVKIGNPASQVNQYTKVLRDYLKSEYFRKHGEHKNFKINSVVVFSHEQSNISNLKFTSKGRIGKVKILLVKELISYIRSYEEEKFGVEELQEIAEMIVPPDQRDQTGYYPVLAELPKDNLRNRYQILEEIGRGSSGSVYRGFDNKLDREVAIKRLDTSVKNREAIDRFVQEAKITARLQHENIVRFYDYYEDNNDCFLIMELVEGLNLQDLIDEGPLTLSDIREIFPAVVSALSHAHANNIVHRDLKAANILVTANRVIKVTDFGVARIMDHSNVTQTRASIGTPSIMAPEQIRGEKVDFRTDIYALGVLLYQMLTGRLPYPGESLGEVVHNILTSSPERPSELNLDASETLDDVVLKALEKDAEDRYESVEQMLAVFHKAISDEFELDPNQTRNQGVLENVFRAGQSWAEFWSHDRRRFVTIVLMIMLAISWLTSLQIYANTRSPELSPERQAQENQNHVMGILHNEDFGNVGKQLDHYFGARVMVTATVENVVQKTDSGWLMQLEIPTKNDKSVRILGSYGGDVSALLGSDGEDKQIQISGRIDKSATVDRVTRNVVELPVIMVDRVEVIEPWNVLVPVLKEIPVWQTISRGTREVSIMRMELAESETRLYMSVKNTGKDATFISLANPMGVQGDRRVYQKYNLESNYNLEIAPGQEVTGVVILGPIQDNGEVTFRLGNDVLGEEPWVFRVRW